MTKIAFIGVGNMGGPMVLNMVRAGHDVSVFDLVEENLVRVEQGGATRAASSAEAVHSAEVVITMLPAGTHVKDVYTQEILPNVPTGTVLIDCSTIDIASSIAVHEAAAAANCQMVDAPVSGGVPRATDGSLTFMVGGSDTAYSAAEPVLRNMGANIFHCGGNGAGQAVKICNNMMVGIQMASTAEAFALGEKLGVDPQKLYDVASVSTGQCWSLTSYCAVPGIVPTAPSNNNYEGGFASALMLKDMNLAMEAAKSVGGVTSVAQSAAAHYQAYSDAGAGNKDFSGILELVRKAH